MTGSDRVCSIIPARALSALYMCTDVNFLFVEILMFLLPLWRPSSLLHLLAMCLVPLSEFDGHLPLPWASKHLRWPAAVLWAWEGPGKASLGADSAQDLWLPGVLLFALE